MPRKSPRPIITHTELLNLAFKELLAQLRGWETSNIKHPEFKEFNEEQIKPIREKMIAINQMYLFETGTELDWDI